VAPGAVIVRLDEAVVPLTASLQDLGQTWRYRIGPSGRDHADPAMVDITANVGREALKPLSPVCAKAVREAGGVRLVWVRRTRLDGDGWDAVDVPLGEDAERYEIDILKGDAVVRTIVASQSSAFYAAAEELADFGSPQTLLALRIAQVSAVAGRGFEQGASVPV
jgi:hypothetical protein